MYWTFVLIIIMTLGVHGYDDPLLLEAVKSGDNASLLNLLANYSDREVLKKHLNNLLLVACEYKHSDTSLLLLKEIDDPNVAKSDDGLTPLMISSRDGLMSVCVALVEKGAKLEATDFEGATALFYAVENSRDDVVKLLTDYGANPNARKTNNGESLLHSATSIKSVDIIIEKGGDIDAKDFRNRTPLITACIRSYDKVAELLIEKGANVSLTDGTDKSPLIWASKKGLKNVVNSLINATVDVNANDVGLKTALTHACLDNRTEIVDILIKNGADVNATDDEGKTPLMYATEYGYLKILKLLIENGANVNEIDHNGNTALLLASGGSEHIVLNAVDILLNNGADIDAWNEERFTALDKAKANGNTQVVNLIEKAELRNELDRMKIQFKLMFESEKESLIQDVTDVIKRLVDLKLGNVKNDIKELRDLITKN